MGVNGDDVPRSDWMPVDGQYTIFNRKYDNSATVRFLRQLHDGLASNTIREATKLERTVRWGEFVHRDDPDAARTTHEAPVSDNKL